MTNNSADGLFTDITGDGCTSIQIALFSINTESIKKPQFISSFRINSTKFSKIGTNIRYFFNSRLKPINSDSFDPVITLLSKSYDITQYIQFLNDFHQIIWVTYRENFRSLSRTKLINSDVGWGCTIRVGQMLLLQMLKQHLKTCDSKLIWDIQENLESAPYSLHRIVEASTEFGKKPGDWHSPSSIAFVLTVLLNENVKKLKCIIGMNCAIYRDEVLALALDIEKGKVKDACKCKAEEYIDLGVYCCGCGKKIISNRVWKNSLFIQVPIMLGIGNVLPEYIECLKAILGCEFTVGIIGGKPRMALFIVGYTQGSFIVLDPHLVQSSAKSEEEFNLLLGSYHCKTPMGIPFEQIEGSFNIGFYIKNEEEWFRLEQLLTSKKLKGIIGVFDSESEFGLASTETLEINSSAEYQFVD